MTLPYRHADGLQVVVFERPEERVQGLQHRASIQDNTLYVFPDTPQGSVFHSRNVPEPFEIAFLSSKLVVISVHLVVPPTQTVVAPPESSMAVEAKAGVLPRWGFMPGVDVSF